MPDNRKRGSKKKKPPDQGAGDAAESDKQEILPPEILAKLKLEGIDPAEPQIQRITRILLKESLEISSGPVPPPGMCAEYEKIWPGFTKKMVAQAVVQSRHRRTLETQMVSGAEQRRNRGQIMAGSVAFCGVALSAYLAFKGLITVPIIMLLLCIGGPTAAIALSRKVNSIPKEQNEPKG